jgi:hypothetical protein
MNICGGWTSMTLNWRRFWTDWIGFPAGRRQTPDNHEKGRGNPRP